MDSSSLAQFVQHMQLDVEALPEARVRQVVGQVLNLVEEVVQENRRLLEENEGLRKLLHKARVVPPPKPPASAAANPMTAEDTGSAKPGGCSSEKERRSREGRKRSRGDRRSFRPIQVVQYSSTNYSARGQAMMPWTGGSPGRVTRSTRC